MAGRGDRQTQPRGGAGAGVQHVLPRPGAGGPPSRGGFTEAAERDLEWVRTHRESFPPGLQRSVNVALALVHAAGTKRDAATPVPTENRAETDAPMFTTDAWLTVADGFHFVPPRLVEMAPRIYVAQGYDFAEIAFVLTEDGIVAIDAGTTEANATAALAALRAVTDLPLRAVIITPRPLGSRRRDQRLPRTGRGGDRPGEFCRRTAHRQRDRGARSLFLWYRRPGAITT